MNPHLILFLWAIFVLAPLLVFACWYDQREQEKKCKEWSKSDAEARNRHVAESRQRLIHLGIPRRKVEELEYSQCNTVSQLIEYGLAPETAVEMLENSQLSGSELVSRVTKLFSMPFRASQGDDYSNDWGWCNTYSLEKLLKLPNGPSHLVGTFAQVTSKDLYRIGPSRWQTSGSVQRSG